MKGVCQVLSALHVQNHNHPVASGIKKRRNAGIWPTENFYVPLKEGPMFAKPMAFVWHFSQRPEKLPFLNYPFGRSK